MSLSVTIDDILSFDLCGAHTREQIEAFFCGKESVDSAHIINLPRVSQDGTILEDEHKLHIVLRPQLLTVQQLDLIRADFLALIPADSEYRSFVAEKPLVSAIGKMMRGLKPASNDDTASRLLIIVRARL